MDVGTSYKWGYLYQMFREEIYPKISLMLRDVNPYASVYQLIKKLGLHKVTAKTTMFPYATVISWLINRANIESRLIKDASRKSIASFQPSSLEICYKFLQHIVDLTKEWILQFSLNYCELLKSWWINRKDFKAKRLGTYPTKHLRNP